MAVVVSRVGSILLLPLYHIPPRLESEQMQNRYTEAGQ